MIDCTTLSIATGVPSSLSANARYYNHAEGGRDIEFGQAGSSIDFGKVQSTPGTYPVTFSGNGGISVTVNANVVENGGENVGNKEYIAANNFRVSAADVTTKGLSDGSTEAGKRNLISLASAKAWYMLEGAHVKYDIDVATVESTIKPV